MTIRLAVAAAVLCGCAAAQKVAVYETRGDRSRLLERRETGAEFAPGAAASFDIAVDEAIAYQTMDGFGASLTDSSAWLIAKKLAPEARAALMRSLFDAADGIGLTLLRQPMGASDFSASGNYTYDDVPAGETDPELRRFSIEHDREYILPLLRHAIAVNPAIKVIAVPWSPPAWMKTNASLNGGAVRTDAFAPLAAYFVRFIQAYAAERVPVYAVAMQNEPLYANAGYPTALVTAAGQAEFIGRHLGPALESAGLGAVKILAYDHNWDNTSFAETVLGDAEAARYTSGAAFHCYGGDVSAQSRVKEKFPAKDIWFTECSGTVGSSFAGDLVWNASNLLIGATRNHARGITLWNLALDQNSGPKNGGCPNCRGVVTIDHSGNPPVITRNVEYYVLGHAAKFVMPGARRIESGTYGKGSLESVAFRNPDGSIVLIVLNGANGVRAFTVSWRGKNFSTSLEAGALATFVWGHPAPSFPSAGVVNAAEPHAGLSPGALFSIYGTDLAGEVQRPSLLPLATTLAGTRVSVNGVPAPLLYMGPGQVNAQVPWETPAGTATVRVVHGEEQHEESVTVQEAGPALFTIDGTFAASLNEDGSPNLETSPVPAGKVIVLFGTGQGPVTKSVPDGEGGPAGELSRTVQPVTATVDGRSAAVEFAGLAPFLVGLAQVNVRVPPDTPAGAASVVLTIAGRQTPPARIWVGR